MKLHSVRIRNFRCYKDEVKIEIGDLTSLIGKNDIGKSAILDALGIFFEVAKPDADDATRDGDRSDMAITCEFEDLPASLVIDATSRTDLKSEYLLNADGRLEVSRVFNGALKTPTAKTYLRAVHPTANGVNDLLTLKITELRTRAQTLGVDVTNVNQSISAELRGAIRSHVGDLETAEVQIDTESQPGAKEIYARISETMPSYYLFRSDRASTDQDSEAQDPMKVAVKLAIEQQRDSLGAIAERVKDEINQLMVDTLENIGAMSPEIASELSPIISDPKWESVFKISLTSDDAIPLNKRGSGVRRLVLLGFLQAQATSKRILNPEAGIIYAIEEPETSQHPDKQRALLKVLGELAEQDGYQVIVTTHTPMLARALPESTLRFISGAGASRTVHEPSEDTMRLVVDALGVLPDHNVRVFVGIEGKHDESALKRLSALVAGSDEAVDDFAKLEDEGKLMFIPVGGSNAGLWVSRLHHLNRPEFHIFDRDEEPPAEPHYKPQADIINARPGCKAVHTSKRELENYLHPNAIAAARPEVVLTGVADFDDVPDLVAEALHTASESEKPWAEVDGDGKKRKASNAKKWLNDDAMGEMTVARLSESDPDGELVGWLREITALAR